VESAFLSIAREHLFSSSSSSSCRHLLLFFPWLCLLFFEQEPDRTETVEKGTAATTLQVIFRRVLSTLTTR
jgi:hypothetical protein